MRPGHVPGGDALLLYSRRRSVLWEPRRRTVVFFTPELRETVRRDSDEMHQLYHRGHTPKAKPSKSCNACSLKELCLPQLVRRESVQTYLRRAMEESP